MSDSSRSRGDGATRRRFLALAGAGAVALITGCQMEPQPKHTPTDEPMHRFSSPEPTGGTSLVPSPEAFGPQVRITPTEGFFVQSYDEEPKVAAEEWSLVIDGAVNEPLTLSYDALHSLPAEDVMWSVECIGNPVGGDLIGNAVWRGTRLAPLLAQVGVQPEAIEARFYALDGYSTSVALERLAHPDTFLAYQMNGYPLAREHGYPVRMLIPGLYGQKMPKWLSRVECITEPYLGHYESTGWSNEATIQVNSKIEQPRYGEQVASGRVVVRGIAHAGLAGVESMEVGVSDSEGQNTTWLDVELLHGPTYAAWTQWRAVWEAQAGTFLVQAVATDGNGVRQTGEGRAFPNGTSGIHTVVVQVAESSS